MSDDSRTCIILLIDGFMVWHGFSKFNKWSQHFPIPGMPFSLLQVEHGAFGTLLDPTLLKLCLLWGSSNRGGEHERKPGTYRLGSFHSSVLTAGSHGGFCWHYQRIAWEWDMREGGKSGILNLGVIFPASWARTSRHLLKRSLSMFQIVLNSGPGILEEKKW
jgi:hypothetical protein